MGKCPHDHIKKSVVKYCCVTIELSACLDCDYEEVDCQQLKEPISSETWEEKTDKEKKC